MAKLICKFTGVTLNNNFDVSLLPNSVQRGEVLSIHPLFILDNKTFIHAFESAVRSHNFKLSKICAISAIQRMGLIRSSEGTKQDLSISIFTSKQFKALILFLKIYINLPEKVLERLHTRLPTFSENIPFSSLAEKLQKQFVTMDRVSVKVTELLETLGDLSLATIDYDEELETLDAEVARIENARTVATDKKKSAKQNATARSFPQELVAHLELSDFDLATIQDLYTTKQDKLFSQYTINQLIEVHTAVHDQIADLPNDLFFQLTDFELHFSKILKRYGEKLTTFGLEVKNRTVNRKLGASEITFEIISAVSDFDMTAPEKKHPKIEKTAMLKLLKRSR